MGYTKTGFVTVQRATLLAECAQKIIAGFGANLDKEVGIAVRSLAKSDNERASNLFFERLLGVSHDKFASEPKLHTAFLIFLSHFLHETGYIATSPIMVDYVDDPTCVVDDVVTRMLATRAPKFSAQDLNNEFCTLSTIASFLPEAIRRYALIDRERRVLTERFFKWISTIAYKLLRGGEALNQLERTAFVMYCRCEAGTPGFSNIYNPGRIVPAQNTDPLVAEAGALYASATLPGPWSSHQKFISDTVYERLTAWIGLHAADIRLSRGYAMSYGPFFVYDFEPQETLPWTLPDQLAGLTSHSSYLGGKRPDASYFAVRVPYIESRRNAFGRIAMYPDDPFYRLTLVNEQDAGNYHLEFTSRLKQRPLSSMSVPNLPAHALTEMLLDNATGGACQMESQTLETYNNQLLMLRPRAAEKVTYYEGNKIEETFLLPSESGLKEIAIDVTSQGARFGTVEARSAFSEFADLPPTAFMAPAPQMVEYVTAVYGLTVDERKRFAPIIALYHNTNRYIRMTKDQPLPIDRLRLAKAILTSQ